MMKQLKALVAAVGLDRFTAQDIVALSQVGEKSVYALIAQLTERGSIVKKDATRERTRGRPSIEYVWDPAGLAMSRAQLRELSTAEADDPSDDPWIEDPIVDGLQRATGLIVAAENGADPHSLELIHARIDAALETLTDEALPRTAEQRVAIATTEIRARALKAHAASDVVRHSLTKSFTAPLHQAVRCLGGEAGWDRGALARIPAGQFAIVLDMLGAANTRLHVRSAIEGQGLSCLVMPFHEATQQRRERALEYLARFFLSPVTSFCVFVLGDFAGQETFARDVIDPMVAPERLRHVVDTVHSSYQRVLSSKSNVQQALALGSVPGSMQTEAVLVARGRTGFLLDILDGVDLSSRTDRLAFADFLMQRPVLLNASAGNASMPNDLESRFEWSSADDLDLGEFVRAVFNARLPILWGAGTLLPDSGAEADNYIGGIAAAE